MKPSRRSALVALASLAASTLVSAQRQDQDAPPRDTPRYRSDVDMVTVTATAVDANGRFVRGLHAEDFLLYEDDQPQEISYFSAERVPVSLGLLIDTSGSMRGEKIDDARTALDRFVYELLDEQDELFLYRFSDRATLAQDWTTDRDRLSRAMGRLVPDGGTALYDALMQAIPFAATGHHQKKAIVIISDGNDTSSEATLRDVRDKLRDSEVLLYAVGIDSDNLDQRLRSDPAAPFPRNPPQAPSPFPPGRGRNPGGGPGRIFPQFAGQGRRPGSGGGGGRPSPYTRGDDRVNAQALRDLTDDSGGRTEIIRSSRDLNPATAGIADELSRQYSLGYASPARKDGHWHAIRVLTRDQRYRVRARRGYVAS
jgi:VWFA-related protein